MSFVSTPLQNVPLHTDLQMRRVPIPNTNSYFFHVFSGIPCDKPEINNNTTVLDMKHQFFYGDIVKYLCDAGFRRTSGNYSRVCQYDGSWAGLPLNCSRRFNNVLTHKSLR